ncbi:uncharacterized protein IUM83_07273 [Phytophthora cinnamomi]|uniref:uncharacterized protein n=1 Tax=Phytophthora cinnamomi TaxID=4785 RepID=UPI003559ACB6|nr:hypothetical protein IUM83_07273 [Phytophthora cinnamomi]
MGAWMKIHQKRGLIEKATDCPAMSQAALAAWVKAPAQSTVSDIPKNAALIMSKDYGDGNRRKPVKVTSAELETRLWAWIQAPNTTTFLQPMDAGIIALFKRAYRRRQLLWVYEKVKDVKKLKKESYAVDQLQAMRWSKEIWQELQGTAAQPPQQHVQLIDVRYRFDASPISKLLLVYTQIRL